MKFKSFGKDAGHIAMEAGLVAGGAILTAKFLDFETLWEKKIEADPTYADKWFIKHQGAVKAGIGIAGGAMFWNKLPNWGKALLLGLVVQGAVQEVGTLATDKDGVKFFNPIGRNGNGGADLTALNKLLEDAAAMNGMNPTTEFPTNVSGPNANPAVDLTMDASTAVSGMGNTGAPNDFGNF